MPVAWSPLSAGDWTRERPRGPSTKRQTMSGEPKCFGSPSSRESHKLKT